MLESFSRIIVTVTSSSAVELDPRARFFSLAFDILRSEKPIYCEISFYESEGTDSILHKYK